MLPARPGPVKERAGLDFRGETAGSHKLPLILIVDDDPGTLKVMRVLLEGNGFAVHSASSVEDALPFLRDVVPDLMILDVEMPGLSGYDLCHIVKHGEHLAHVPVIFLTGKGSAPDYKTGFDAGAVAYMTKPYNQNSLLHMVMSLTKFSPGA